jgi:hypothetical protein
LLPLNWEVLDLPSTEIGSPGTKTLFQEQVTIMEAIANAGDITITGDRAVTVMRKTPTELLCKI